MHHHLKSEKISHGNMEGNRF